MTDTESLTLLHEGPSIDERQRRLEAGVEALVAERAQGSVVHRDHFLLAVAGALMALGVCVILIGWSGAANSTLVEEQVPYLISGGLLGVALTTIGALTFFSYWLTIAVREARARELDRRRDHAEMMSALQAIAEAVSPSPAKGVGNGRARSSRAQRQVR